MLVNIPKDTKPHHIYMCELTPKLIEERAKRNLKAQHLPVKELNPFTDKRIPTTY